MTFPRSSIAILASLLCFAAAPVVAQDEEGGGFFDRPFFDGRSIGAQVRASTNIYAGAPDRLLPVPALGRNEDEFSIAENGIRFRLFERDAHRFSAVINPRFAPYSPSDSEALAGMRRSFSADVGLHYRFTTSSDLRFGFMALTEATDEHRGQQFEARVTQGLQRFGVPVAVFGGVLQQTEDLTEFLYGVRPGEVRPGRPEYSPGAATLPYLGMSTLVPVTDRISITGTFRTDFYPDEVTDSPIVVEDMSVSGSLGFLFEF